MKRIVLAGMLLTVSFHLAGCGITGGSGSGTTSTFFTNTTTTTPVFKPKSNSAASLAQLAAPLQATSTWESGNTLYAVYFSLREFLSSRDEGKVDRANLYKLLTDVDTVYSGIADSAVSITTQEVTAPFSLLSKITADRAVNDTTEKKAIALKQTGNRIQAIETWIWTDSATKKEYGVANLDFDSVTKDITVNMTYSVDYDLSNTTSDYNLRCSVTGNSTENRFEFKYIIGTTKIVAKGVSKGAGNYMLFKYAEGSNPAKFIVVPADSDENFFISQNTTPTNIYTSADDLPASVASYKDWVVSTDFLSATDLMRDTATLNSGNSQAGTIYLNYE